MLLPGITTLERFIAEIRSRMDSRLWRMLIKNLTDEQRTNLNNLLLIEDNKRRTALDVEANKPVLPGLFALLLQRYPFVLPQDLA